jgi:hypothetical protein
MRLTLFVITCLSIVVSLGTASLEVLASPAAPKKQAVQASAWPASNAAHRDIFCGTDGAEPSLRYAKTLNAELDALTARGATIAAAMDALRERAKCPPGSQSPVPELFTGGTK